jgi:hypothetical protein
MVTQEILDYIQKSKQQGMPEEKMLESLRSVGWKEEDIQEAMNEGRLSADNGSYTILLTAGELLKRSWEAYKKTF